MPSSVTFVSTSLDANLIVRIVDREVPENERKISALVHKEGVQNFEGYALILVDEDTGFLPVPWLNCGENLSGFRAGDVVQIDVKHHRISFLYRAGSNSNGLYVTDRCNSHCIMCPQPPKEFDTVEFCALERTIDCLPNNLCELGITGGEPTLLGESLAALLKKIERKSPDCHVHILSNARKFKNFHYAQCIRQVGLRNLTFGVPLYSYNPENHDYIVQVAGAFDETIHGIHNLAKLGFPIEIRVVLHKQTIPELLKLSNYIYRNLPFVFHVAFMGMEHMGYVKKNWDALWISPKDYQDTLYEAVRYLHLRGVSVSLYNLPYCLLDKRLWPFSRDSISDYKVGFTKLCDSCAKKNDCGGLFSYQMNQMQITPIKN